MTELSLPERRVHAAETAIEGAAISVEVYQNVLGSRADGYTSDMAKASASAVIEELAKDMEANDGAGHAALLRMLADCIRAVPAVKAV